MLTETLAAAVSSTVLCISLRDLFSGRSRHMSLSELTRGFSRSRASNPKLISAVVKQRSWPPQVVVGGSPVTGSGGGGAAQASARTAPFPTLGQCWSRATSLPALDKYVDRRFQMPDWPFPANQTFLHNRAYPPPLGHHSYGDVMQKLILEAYARWTWESIPQVDSLKWLFATDFHAFDLFSVSLPRSWQATG